MKILVMPEDITEDLSNDQYYEYKTVKLIMEGEIDKCLLSLKTGPVSH